MDIGDFNLEELIEYLNSELLKGRSMKNIEIDDFGVNERVITKRLDRKGYKRIDNQFTKVNVKKSRMEKQNLVIAKSKMEYDNNKMEVIRGEIVGNSSERSKYEESNTLIIHSELKDNILNLAENHKRIMSMLEAYEKDKDNQYANKYDAQYDNEITIELPIETKKDYRATIRVNNIIWEQFSDFCEAKKSKIFTKRDLISMALKEYMEKHK